MELYVTRHGETEWNALNKVCGTTDVELTEKGRYQAKDLAERVRKYPVARILCSPLLRARRTAEIVAEVLGVPCAVDERLTEVNYGTYEGADRNRWDFINNKRQFAYRYPDGESILQVARRVYSLLDELTAGQHPEEPCLLVAHNGICRVIHCYFNDLTNEDYFRFNCGNCELRRYEF